MKIRYQRQIAKARQALLILTLAICSGTRLPAAEWRIEGVDPGGGGKFSSLKLDKAGNAHVAYYDEGRHELKYAFRDRRLNKWFTTRLDTTAGFCSLALDSKEQPHISYLLGNGKLSYIHWNGRSWDKQTLDINAKVIDFYTSITLGPNDHPRISFYEYWGMGDNYELHMRNVKWAGNRWEVQTIDPTPGSGKFNSIATAASGLPQIAYANVKAEDAGLRYAEWNGKSWAVTVLEGATAPHPVYSVAMALDKNGEPRIVYTDLTANLVKYAAMEKGKWQIQPVDSVVEAAYPDRNGITLDDDGNPYLSYYDGGAGVLKVAYRVNGKWVTETVDQNSNGFTSSLQIGQGYIWMTYSDASGGSLQFAYRKLAPSGTGAEAQKPSQNK
jgi:hypothetical protein